MRISDWSSDVCSSELRWQPERADAADRMTGDRQNIFGAQHAWFCPEPIAKLPVIEPARARHDDEYDLVFRRHADRLGDLFGSNSMRCGGERRSEEHTSELQSLMRNSYAVFCLKKKKT